MNATRTARRVVRTVRDRNVPFMAASFAYYALASVVPLLLVALALLSVFGAANLLVDALSSSLSQSGTRVLRRVLSGTSGRGVAGVIGFLLAFWSGMKVFRGLSVAFAEVYDAESNLSLGDQLKKGLLVLGLVLFGIVLLSATSVVLTFVNFSFQYSTLVGNLVAIAALTLAFLPLYYVLPPVPVTVRHALPGSVLAAVGWVLLQVAFFYYAQSADKYAAYGILGAVLLFVTFLYFAGILLLVGAVVNVVLERATPRAEMRVPR